MRPGGDVNEDDVPDVLIGFPLAGTRTDGRNEAGVTYAVYGQAATGPDRALETIPGQFGARVVAPVVHDHGGTSPAPVGWSVSPDEAGVLIGAPGAGFRTGAAYVVRSSQFAGDDRSARGESSEELTDAAGFRCRYNRR